MSKNVYYDEFVKQCRELGLGDLTLHHDKLADEPLSKEDWAEVYRTTLAYQFHLRMIVAHARARTEKK